MLNASTESDFDAVFAKINQLRASGLVISAGTAFFVSRSGQLAALAARHAVPSVSAGRALVMAEGLISYGVDIFDAHRLTGPLPNRVLTCARRACPVLSARVAGHPGGQVINSRKK